MFDEDPFNVFDESSSSAAKSRRQAESESPRATGTKTKHHENVGNSDKSDNKR